MNQDERGSCVRVHRLNPRHIHVHRLVAYLHRVLRQLAIVWIDSPAAVRVKLPKMGATSKDAILELPFRQQYLLVGTHRLVGLDATSGHTDEQHLRTVSRLEGLHVAFPNIIKIDKLLERHTFPHREAAAIASQVAPKVTTLRRFKAIGMPNS